MKKHEGPADDGHKLQTGKKGRREDASEVHKDAYSVNGAFRVVIAVKWPGATRTAASVEGEVLESSKGKSHECSAKDEEEDKVITL
jgi:hypothetical protein